jgi:hypothetical protein
LACKDIVPPSRSALTPPAARAPAGGGTTPAGVAGAARHLSRLSTGSANASSPLSAPSDDDLPGNDRLVRDPDSPTSRLLVRAARRAMGGGGQGGDAAVDKRFSYEHDIARNPRLARAARAEIDAASGHASPASSGSGRGAPGGAAAGGAPFFEHDGEIKRQAAAVRALVGDVEKESSINLGMGALLLGRLQSGRAAAERLLSVLQAFASAEAAYGRAMDAVAKISLAGDADGASLRAAVDAFSGLPMAAGAAHAAVAAALAGAVRAVQAVLADLRAACEEVEHGAQGAARGVDAARKGLKAALAAHHDACRAFDAAVAERQRQRAGGGGGGGGGSAARQRGLDSDPWVAEGRLVEAQAAVQAAQTQQRRYLAVAFRRVGVLERRRVDAVRAALAAFTAAYRAAGLPQPQVGALACPRRAAPGRVAARECVRARERAGAARALSVPALRRWLIKLRLSLCCFFAGARPAARGAAGGRRLRGRPRGLFAGGRLLGAQRGRAVCAPGGGHRAPGARPAGQRGDRPPGRDAAAPRPGRRRRGRLARRLRGAHARRLPALVLRAPRRGPARRVGPRGRALAGPQPRALRL